MNKQSAISNQPSALEWLVKRCNEMDITEQLNWLGDAIKPHEAAAELQRLRAIEAAAREIAELRNDDTYRMYNVPARMVDALAAALNESESQ